MVMGLTEAGYEVDWRRVDNDTDFTAALSPDLDLILADYTLPSFDVRSALTRLAESGLNVPFIVVSGTISEEIAVACIKAGAADYLVKDRLARLPAAVAAAMEARRMRDRQAEAAAELARTAAELAAANTALRAADAMKDHVMAVTAHELRNPLTAILGFAALLREQWGGQAQESGAEWAAIIERQAARTLSYVEDLLTLSAMAAGAVVLHDAPVRLAAALADASDLSGTAGVAIACPPDLMVQADPGRLEQILINLFTNAVKHGGTQVWADAHLDPTHDVVELRIRDDGPGVPADFVPVMFDKFTQPGAGSLGAGGSGLGLAIVAGLTTAHKGEVWYEPNAPSGACFAIRLPAARRGSEPLPGHASPEREGATR